MPFRSEIIVRELDSEQSEICLQLSNGNRSDKKIVQTHELLYVLAMHCDPERFIPFAIQRRESGAAKVIVRDLLDVAHYFHFTDSEET